MEKPRYRTFSSYLRERFSEPVRKISLHAGFTCPNRDGSISNNGCIFCDPGTFSPHARALTPPVIQQIREGVEQGRRKGIHTFIAYFQAYTNTYGRVGELKDIYDTVLAFPEIKAIAIGTRPDCVDPEILKMIHGYTSRYDVWMEYGLQSMHDATLKTINRGHNAEAFLQAVAQTRRFPGMHICAHVILGLPGETLQHELETADQVAALGLEAIKLHPLHVVRGTTLAAWHAAGRYQPMTLEDYVMRAMRFIERLPPDMVIQRLSADCADDHLIAPDWVADKAQVIQQFQALQRQHDSWQGKAYSPKKNVKEASHEHR